MLAWAWTLVRLYKDVRQSKKLLPNKGIFKLHGWLLAAYLLIFLVVQVVLIAITHVKEDGTYLVLVGSIYILLCVGNLLEMATFFLVVKLMLPITKPEKDNRARYKQFLFMGFLDVNQLKYAVYRHNPGMSADQRSFVEHDLSELQELIASSE